MTDIYEDMEKPFLPMLIINWIFGIGIIEFPISKPHRILSFIYTSLILTIYGYLAYIAYPSYLITWLSRKKPLTERMFFFANIILTVTVIISGWFQTKVGLKKCIIKATSASHLMQKLGIPNNHSEILKRELSKFAAFFVFILSVIVVNSFVTFGRYHATSQQIIAVFIQNFPIVVVFVADTSFFNILGYAYFKFESLNELLQNLLISRPDLPLHRRISKEQLLHNSKLYSQEICVQAESKDYTFVIKTAKLAHLQLVKLCRQANSIYGLHILLSIVVAFVMIINCIFNAYLCLYFGTRQDFIFKELIRSINWFLYFCIKTIATSWFCTIVCKISVKSGDLICELYDEPLITEGTKDEIQNFTIELIQNKLELTAYGVVPIDLSLVQMMIGTTLTYVILLIQFQKIGLGANSDDNEQEKNKDDFSMGYQRFLKIFL